MGHILNLYPLDNKKKEKKKDEYGDDLEDQTLDEYGDKIEDEDDEDEIL